MELKRILLPASSDSAAATASVMDNFWLLECLLIARIDFDFAFHRDAESIAV